MIIYSYRHIGDHLQDESTIKNFYYISVRPLDKYICWNILCDIWPKKKLCISTDQQFAVIVYALQNQVASINVALEAIKAHFVMDWHHFWKVSHFGLTLPFLTGKTKRSIQYINEMEISDLSCFMFLLQRVIYFIYHNRVRYTYAKLTRIFLLNDSSVYFFHLQNQFGAY